MVSIIASNPFSRKSASSTTFTIFSCFGSTACDFVILGQRSFCKLYFLFCLMWAKLSMRVCELHLLIFPMHFLFCVFHFLSTYAICMCMFFEAVMFIVFSFVCRLCDVVSDPFNIESVGPLTESIHMSSQWKNTHRKGVGNS